MDNRYFDKQKNIRIQADEIFIGKNVTFGRNIDIDIFGSFSIGDRSHLGDDVFIRGNNISFGKDLYHSRGLKVGGGGYTNPESNLTVGNRCTIHNNYINLADEVKIGNDVGLSLGVDIITHGYWWNVFEGFPYKFEGVNINDRVIIGYKSIIMMGINIGRGVVVGAGSVVTKDLDEYSIYAGVPAKFIRNIIPLSDDEKKETFFDIVSRYREIAKHHGINPVIKINYPVIMINSCSFDLENNVMKGLEDTDTDDFRDYIRKYGFRFFTDRPFKTVMYKK